MRFKRKGQNLSEFTLCLAVISLAFVGMQIYLQRSFQAKYKSGADYLFSQIEQEAILQGHANLTSLNRQYDPYYRESYMNDTKTSDLTQGFPNTSVNATNRRSGWEMVYAPQN